MRTGPHPLPIHIGMATSAWPVMSQAEGEKLAQEMTGGMEKMLRGIRKYQEHPYKPEQEPLPLVWERGTVTVRLCRSDKSKGALIIVPSLINRSAILDLCAERSFTRWMAGQGLNVYLLDWGDVSKDSEQDNIDALVLERLLPALEFIAAKEGEPVAGMGYCMGGTLLLGAAVHRKQVMNRLVMLAAPWDFHAGRQDLLNRIKFWAPATASYVNAGQPLPVEAIQTLFASLDPVMSARKFASFDDMDQNSDTARLFIAVEDWLNDGVSLPAQVAKHCIENWFFANEPGRGQWRVGGVTVDPAAIAVPVLVVTSKKDRLVEYEQAAKLVDIIPGAKILEPGCGHIGMIAGARSVEDVWQPIAAFLKS